tara:strand:- start:367 stop:675 length:309 start_codon:yes stop_codon:yes gene_type:complete
MEIYCKHKPILERAVKYANKLGIADKDAIINIYKLPPSFRQQAIIEHPREYEDTTHLNIYVKFNDERYISLAHEMIHARQILNHEPIDENEAYLLENTLDND